MLQQVILLVVASVACFGLYFHMYASFVFVTVYVCLTSLLLSPVRRTVTTQATLICIFVGIMLIFMCDFVSAQCALILLTQLGYAHIRGGGSYSSVLIEALCQQAGHAKPRVIKLTLCKKKCTISWLGPIYSRSEYCAQYSIWCTNWPNYSVRSQQTRQLTVQGDGLGTQIWTISLFHIPSRAITVHNSCRKFIFHCYLLSLLTLRVVREMLIRYMVNL